MGWSKKQIPGNSWVMLILRLALGGIFVAASLSKILDGANFANLVASYGFLPYGMAQAYGLLLPWIEVVIAGLLIIGIFPRLVASGAIALVVSFMAANTYSLVYGTGGSCACFGEALPLSHTQSLLLDGAMLFMAIPLLFSGGESRPVVVRHLSSRSFCTIMIAVVILGSFLPQSTAVLAGIIADGKSALVSQQAVLSELTGVDPESTGVGTAIALTDQAVSVGQRVDASLDTGKPAFLFFYADWCGLCQKEKPTIDKLEKDYSKLVTFMRLNDERDGDAFRKFGVSSFPTIFLITGRSNDDYQGQKFVGPSDESQLAEALGQVLPLESRTRPADAYSALDSHADNSTDNPAADKLVKLLPTMWMVLLTVTLAGAITAVGRRPRNKIEKYETVKKASLELAALGCALVLLVAACAAPTPTPAPGKVPARSPSSPAVSKIPSGKPNIILVLADDLDASAIQYMPKLKSLITDQGETFTNYFVSESLCCPSRATTLRGQYSHNTEVLGNHLPSGGFKKFYKLDEEKSTIATWLQDAGYRTMLAGKYLNEYPPKTDPLYIPRGWTEWYSPMKGDPYAEYGYTLNENGKQVAYGKGPKDYGTDVYVGKTVDFIKRSAKDKPFFIYLAPYAPHSPYEPAPRHANLFPDLKAPRTPNYNEADVSDKPAYIQNRSLLTKAQQDLIDKDYRLRAQSLQAVDEGIEEIVNELKGSGELENTYIFFVSDNGYHLGNHRQLTGKVSPYEEEMRVTMVVRGPRVPAGITVKHLTGNVDLAPTWAELADAKAADFCDGRSLVPLMRANPPPLDQWRQEFPFEYEIDKAGGPDQPDQDNDPGLLEPQDQDEEDLSRSSPEKQSTQKVPPFRGIRLQSLSYVEYKTGEIELYDVKEDPYELQNLVSEASPKLLAQLSARLKELVTCKANECRKYEDAPFDLPARFAQTSTRSPKQFGVFVGRLDSISDLNTVNEANRLGVGWVRLNPDLGVASPEYVSYLDAGINVVLTVRNRNQSNITATYGTPKEWAAASFPYKSREKYQEDVRTFLQPALKYLKAGQKVWVQGGNEVFDASEATDSLYWRGTMEQYLDQQQALYTAVKSVDPDITVVLAGLASATLDGLILEKGPGHARAVQYVTDLMTKAKFDAVDLHFYGCEGDIPAKVKAVKSILPAGLTVPWISTENGGPEIGCKSTPVSWSKDLAQFEKLQAQQVPARLSACAEQGGSICMWFSLFDFKNSADIFNHLGLLDQDTTPPRKKPAYDAFTAFMIQQR